jgi:hypothetical protein
LILPLKQQKIIEQNKYWTKLNPGEIFILASIVKKCLQESRFSDLDMDTIVLIIFMVAILILLKLQNV